MSRLMSLIALIAVIVVIGLLFYKVMVGFFVPVFLAAVLVVVFRPLHQYILKRSGNRPKFAAAATSVLIMLSVLFPFGLIASSAAVQGVALLQDFNAGSVQTTLVKFRNSLGLTREFDAELLRVQVDLDKLLSHAALVDANDPRTSGIKRNEDGQPFSDELIRMGRSVAESIHALQQAVMASPVGKRNPDLEQKFAALVELAENFGTLKNDELYFLGDATILASNFRPVRAEVLGGNYLAAVKDMANPTREQITSTTTQVREYLQPRLLSLTSATVGFVVRLVIGCAILIVCVFFFLYDGPQMVRTMMALIPLDDRYEAELLMEFDRVSRAVVLATIFSAITQGAVAGLGYYVAGLPSLALLIMLTTMFAMIPFVGPAIVWIPACFYLAFYDNNIWAAVGLALWGVLVVGTVDNFVKAGVLHGQSQLHPLLALLSVLGGVQALGPVGIVVGPMAVVLLQTSLSILQREMVHLEDHGFLNGRRGESAQARRFRLRRRRRRPVEEVIAPATSGGLPASPSATNEPNGSGQAKVDDASSPAQVDPNA